MSKRLFEPVESVSHSKSSSSLGQTRSTHSISDAVHMGGRLSESGISVNTIGPETLPSRDPQGAVLGFLLFLIFIKWSSCFYHLVLLYVCGRPGIDLLRK